MTSKPFTPNRGQVIDFEHCLDVDNLDGISFEKYDFSGSIVADRKKKRDSYFLKGPLYFPTIRQLIGDPAARLVLVAYAFANMARTDHCTITRKLWECAGIEGKDTRYRVLIKLRKSKSDVRVSRQPGCSPVLHFDDLD